VDCTIDKVGEGFKITRMHLAVRGKAPNVDAATFDKIAQATKDGCPVSQVFKGNVQMTLEAKLE
jgi:osmotically inducible protein OsmC